MHVIDGLCPHMGVSFAAHGIIEADGITCRFHGWNWDGEGRNVWVPTQRRAMAVFDLRLHILSPGSTFDLKTRRPSPKGSKVQRF